MWASLFLMILINLGNAVSAALPEDELAPNIFLIAQNMETLAPQKLADLFDLSFKSCESDPLAAIEWCALKKNYEQWRAAYNWIQKQSQYDLNQPDDFENYVVDIRPQWQDLDLQTVSWSFSIAADMSDKKLIQSTIKKILSWSLLKKTIAYRLNDFKKRFQKNYNHPSMTTYSTIFPLITAWSSSPLLIKQLWTLSQSMDCRETPLCLFQKRALENMVCRQALSFQKRSSDVLTALKTSHILYDPSLKDLSDVLDLQNELQTQLTDATWEVVNRISPQTYVQQNDDVFLDFNISEALFEEITERATLSLNDDEFIQKSFVGVYLQSILEIGQRCTSSHKWSDEDQRRLSTYRGADDIKKNLKTHLETSLRSFESILAGVPLELKNVP